MLEIGACDQCGTIYSTYLPHRTIKRGQQGNCVAVNYIGCGE